MKNVLFFIIIILSTSCAEEVASNLNFEKKVYQSKDATVLNKLFAEIPNTSETMFRSRAIPNSKVTATTDLIKLIDKTPISDWKELDVEVKKEIGKLENNNKNKKYDIAIQNATYRFLAKKLYKVDESQNINNELYFYLDLLISKEAIEWDMLAYGILKLEEESNLDIKAFKNYTIDGAQTSLDKYLKLKEEKLKEKNDAKSFHQHTLSHYQRIIDDANYALTHLLSKE